MQVYKTKGFAKFTRKKKINDSLLCEAVERAERGLIDADLGDGLIKQRIPRPNEGRSGGYRAFIAYQVGDLMVFIYGFAKNEQDNINDLELEELHKIVGSALKLDNEKIENLVEIGEWIEVNCDD